jgi:hypothetical protein
MPPQYYPMGEKEEQQMYLMKIKRRNKDANNTFEEQKIEQLPEIPESKRTPIRHREASMSKKTDSAGKSRRENESNYSGNVNVSVIPKIAGKSLSSKKISMNSDQVPATTSATTGKKKNNEEFKHPFEQQNYYQ